MDTLNAPKKASPEDWHPANVVAALRIAGWSLRRLSVHHGLCPTALKNALVKPWPKAERLIAEAIAEAGALRDVTPWLLWPSRYNVSIDADGHEIGVPNRGGPGRKAVVNDTDLSQSRNVKKRKAA